MHIPDGILPAPVWLGGYAIAAAGTALALRRFDERRIPQVAVMASVFFVSSSIPIPGGSSSHFLLNGLVGVVLGWDSVPAISLGLLLQFLLLAHGGFTTLGVNVVTMAGGALAAHHVFRARLLFPARAGTDLVFGLLAGATGVAVSGGLYFAAMVLGDREYRVMASLNLMAHLPLLLIESVVTASAVSFLARVKPELIGLRGARP